MTEAIALAFIAATVLIVAAMLMLDERKTWRELFEGQNRTILDLTNRLLAAQDAGKIIPPSDMRVDDEPEPIALDAAIIEWTKQWEDEAVQQRWAAIARTYAAQGKSTTEVLKALENRIS